MKTLLPLVTLIALSGAAAQGLSEYIIIVALVGFDAPVNVNAVSAPQTPLRRQRRNLNELLGGGHHGHHGDHGDGDHGGHGGHGAHHGAHHDDDEHGGHGGHGAHHGAHHDDDDHGGHGGHGAHGAHGAHHDADDHGGHGAHGAHHDDEAPAAGAGSELAVWDQISRTDKYGCVAKFTCLLEAKFQSKTMTSQEAIVHHYITKRPPADKVEQMSVLKAPYLFAAFVGMRYGSDSCISFFPDCKHNFSEMLRFVNKFDIVASDRA